MKRSTKTLIAFGIVSLVCFLVVVAILWQAL